MRLVIISGLLFSLSTVLLAQDFKAELTLRPFIYSQNDISTQTSVGNITRSDGGGVGGTLQISYNFNSHFNAGIFYSRGGTTVKLSGTGVNVVTAKDAPEDFQSYGLSMQLGTNRYRKFSAYAVINAFSAQLVDTYSKSDLGTDKDLVLSGSGICYSIGGGLLLKLGRRVSLNIIEVKYTTYNGSLNYLNGKTFNGLTWEFGVVYKWLKLK